MADDEHPILSRISDQLERLLIAIEKLISIGEVKVTCGGCLGSGKAYGDHRCMRCGGTGLQKK